MEEIVVTIPRERPFGTVAGLVLGGVAARHELTLDVLDDLQLALETLLDRVDDDGEVNVVLRVDDGARSTRRSGRSRARASPSSSASPTARSVCGACSRRPSTASS